MDNPSHELIGRSGYSRDGFAAHYDSYRPAPPAALLDLLLLQAQVERPRLVVDLGSGTGLSARAWARRAERVIGVEPNPDMRARAEAATTAPNVGFLGAFANETGLPDGCADLVTCSQSLHWMEPEPTFAEAARLLRAGGVFAAYDYDLPPAVTPEVDAALARYLRQRGEARRRQGIAMGADRWAKPEHLARMEASGRFRRCRELLVHSRVETSAERLLGLAGSLGPALDDAREIDELRAALDSALGDATVPAYFGYRVRIGVT